MSALSTWMKPHLNEAMRHYRNKRKDQSRIYKEIMDEIKTLQDRENKIRQEFIKMEKVALKFEFEGIAYDVDILTTYDRHITVHQLRLKECYEIKSTLEHEFEEQAQSIVNQWYADACLDKLTYDEKQEIKQKMLELI